MVSPVASLPMYDLPEVRGTTRSLLAAVVDVVPDPWPEFADHQALLRHWTDPRLGLSQTCGEPLVEALPDVEVLGAFDHEVCDEDGLYRSVIVMRSGDEPRPDMRAAANNPESLSGHTSLLVAASRSGWPSPTIRFTGSHAASAAAIQAGSADIAAIDSVSWWLWRWHRPAAVEGLTVVARGPFIPCTPLIAAPGADVARLRDRLAVAAAEHGAQLGIRRFVPRDRADYERLVRPLRAELAV